MVPAITLVDREVLEVMIQAAFPLAVPLFSWDNFNAYVRDWQPRPPSRTTGVPLVPAETAPEAKGRLPSLPARSVLSRAFSALIDHFQARVELTPVPVSNVDEVIRFPGAEPS